MADLAQQALAAMTCTYCRVTISNASQLFLSRRYIQQQPRYPPLESDQKASKITPIHHHEMPPKNKILRPVNTQILVP